MRNATNVNTCHFGEVVIIVVISMLVLTTVNYTNLKYCNYGKETMET